MRPLERAILSHRTHMPVLASSTLWDPRPCFMPVGSDHYSCIWLGTSSLMRRQVCHSSVTLSPTVTA